MSKDHSAAGSALGYLYQTNWALLDLLERGPDMPDARISLELFDDVAWDAGGSPSERLQLKHHLNNAAAISDKSVDLWRTMKAWIDTSAPADPTGSTLAIVTTANAAVGTAVYLLRPTTLHVSEAKRLLDDAANSSASKETAEMRAAYLRLADNDRLTFVSRIRILDGSDQVTDLEGPVRRALSWALPRNHPDLFMEMLWGWWNNEALQQLRGLRGPISVSEAQERVGEIRDQFTRDRLPTLVRLIDIDPSEIEVLFGNRTFVEQLRLIDWPEINLQKAIIDYYRANVQTTRWLDEDLIGLPDLLEFSLELVDEWKSEFEFMTLDLPIGASESMKRAAGVKLLRHLLESTTIKVRPKYEDPFFTRGKRHELADQFEVGWHPDFTSQLQKRASS